MKFLLSLVFSTQVLYTVAQVSGFDSSQLKEIEIQLVESQIVGLGEVGHGYETINETKAGFVHLLQKNLGFEALLFESSLTASVVSLLTDSTIDLRAKNFLYPFWNTASVRQILDDFTKQEIPYLLGFDIQEDCRYTRFSALLTHNELVITHSDKLMACDSILAFYIGEDFSRKEPITSAEYQLLGHHYGLVEAEINARETDSLRNKLLKYCIQNRKWLCHYLTLKSMAEKMYYRDSLMAQNISWLQSELYSNKKIIVWAADTHVSKPAKTKKPEWMGEWLFSVYGKKYSSISFRKGTGKKSFSGSVSYSLQHKPNEKFDMIIYLQKLSKIKAGEWITPCH